MATNSAATMMKCYRTIGTTPGASDKEMRKAYKRACLKAHPDKPGGSTEKMVEVNTAWDAIQETTSDADEAAPNSNAAEGQNECRSPNVRPEDCGFNARPEDYSGWNTDNNPGYQYAWADSSTYGAQPETFASWNTGSDQAYQYAGATDQNYGAHPGNLPGWDSWKTDSDQAYQYAGATSQNYEAHPWSSFRGYTQDGWTFPSEDIRDGWSVPSGEQEKWS